jgi:hypothetical protein
MPFCWLCCDLLYGCTVMAMLVGSQAEIVAGINPAPPARRIATQGRSHICCNVAMPVRPWLSALAHDSRLVGRQPRQPGDMVRPTRRATMACQVWRVATNVGAALRRDAPRGRRSISQALKLLRRTLGILHAIQRQAFITSYPTRHHPCLGHLDGRESLHRASPPSALRQSVAFQDRGLAL